MLFLRGTASAQQTVSYTLVEGTPVSFSFYVGRRLDISFNGVQVFALSSSSATPLVSASYSSGDVEAGTFSKFWLNFEVPAGVDGEQVVVYFVGAASAGQVNIDQVFLNTNLSPGSSTAAATTAEATTTTAAAAESTATGESTAAPTSTTTAADTNVLSNFDFESDSLPDDNAFATTVTDWVTTGVAGVLNPNVVSYPGGVPSGSNVAFLFQTATLAQQPADFVLSVGVEYKLSAMVGWRADEDFSEGTIAVVPVVSSGPLATITVTTNDVTPGSFTYFEATFTATTAEEVFVVVDSTSSVGQMNVDDVRLTVV